MDCTDSQQSHFWKENHEIVTFKKKVVASVPETLYFPSRHSPLTSPKISPLGVIPAYGTYRQHEPKITFRLEKKDVCDKMENVYFNLRMNLIKSSLKFIGQG